MCLPKSWPRFDRTRSFKPQAADDDFQQGSRSCLSTCCIAWSLQMLSPSTQVGLSHFLALGRLIHGIHRISKVTQVTYQFGRPLLSPTFGTNCSSAFQTRADNFGHCRHPAPGELPLLGSGSAATLAGVTAPNATGRCEQSGGILLSLPRWYLFKLLFQLGPTGCPKGQCGSPP